MKLIKYILRIIVISPFVIGFPISIKLLIFQPKYISIFEGIVILPGLVSCIAVFLTCLGLLVIGISKAMDWIFID